MRTEIVMIAKNGTDQQIAQAASISYGRKYTYEHDTEKIIAKLTSRKEMTPFEFCDVWYYIRCSMACHRQLLQYRTASRITRSYRRTEPLEVENESLISLENDPFVRELVSESIDKYKDVYRKTNNREKARMSLNMCCLTEMYWKIDLRNLIHFIQERACLSAEEEIRNIALCMKGDLELNFPITYKNIFGAVNV